MLNKSFDKSISSWSKTITYFPLDILTPKDFVNKIPLFFSFKYNTILLSINFKIFIKEIESFSEKSSM